MSALGGGRVLAVDEDDDVLARLLVTLPARGFEVACCRTAEEALLRIPHEQPDVVLTDHGMREIDGIELCEQIVTTYPDIPVVLLTAFGTVDTAVAAMRAGAFDFIIKPLDIQVLATSLERAIRQRRLREEVSRLQQHSQRRSGFGDMLGQSPAMKQVFTFVEQTASLNASVLISGESGTGKEMIARALHRKGRRPDGPFVTVNCAALPGALLEDELFGHDSSAPARGAPDAHPGLLSSSAGGTLFLDEIGEVSLVLQAKLLHVLQDRRGRPVISEGEPTFDTRIIAATSRDLESAVRDGEFRSDLYFRLNVLGVRLPPLRGRGTDVLLLAQAFVDRYATEMNKRVTGFGPAVAERLLAYDWPGNVRELQNTIERAVALTHGHQLVVEDLPDHMRAQRPARRAGLSGDATELTTLAEVERRHIDRVLKAVGGSRTDAARILGIGRKTLYRKLRDYEKHQGHPASPSERH